MLVDQDSLSGTIAISHTYSQGGEALDIFTNGVRFIVPHPAADHPSTLQLTFYSIHPWPRPNQLSIGHWID